MYNLKDIRRNFDNFINDISKRKIKINKKDLIDLDEKNRELIQRKESLEREKKDLSKKKDTSQFERSRKISLEIEKLTSEQAIIKKKIDQTLSNIPNLPLSDVPEGENESSNIEIFKKGKLKLFSVKEFYFVLTLENDKKELKEYELPMPFKWELNHNHMIFDYKLESFAKNNEFVLFKGKVLNFKKKSKLYNNIVVLSAV